MPTNGPPALSVAWTLVHELLFYGIFLLNFISKRWLAGALCLWGLVIVLVNMVGAPSGWPRYPLNLLNLDFMLGVGAAWWIRQDVMRNKEHWVALLGVILVCGALWLMMEPGKGAGLRLVFAVGLTLVMVGFAVREQAVGMRWPAALLIMGNASYSIYLIHNPLLSITQRVAGRLGMTWLAGMVWGVVLSMLAGCLYHLAVERPLLQFFRKQLRTSPVCADLPDS